MPETTDKFSHFDLATLPKMDVYKLLASVVLPRPIAWVVSRDSEGVVNAAPFSFFNVLSTDPPLVALSITGASDREHKDSLANIRARKEFVVNMVPEDLAEAMNITATNAPAGTDETQLAGLELGPSAVVDVPRIAGSPVALECRLFQEITPGPRSNIVLGEVVYAHVVTEAFVDVSKMYIDASRLHLIGRMHGTGAYTTTRDLFHIERKTWPLE